ncbi:MAG: DUF11 domain-containing protein, partial [Sphingomonadales bacterium]
MAVSLDVDTDVVLDLGTDTDSDGVADAGETVQGTITITNTGDTGALDVVVADTLNGLTVVPGSVTVTPIAVNDSFAITGNTPITISASQLLGNDLDPDGAEANLIITSISAGTNGPVVQNGDGSFTFTPNTGFNGAASFQYTVTDEDGLTSVSQGTVNIAVTDLTWYVNGDYTGVNGASDGSYARPFTSLAALNGGTGDGTTGDDVDGPNDTIFVYSGTYTGGIVLEAGQSLYGDGHAYTVNGNTIGNATTNSLINFSNYGVVLSTDNDISGITFNGTANGATAIADGNGSVGTLNIDATSIQGLGRADQETLIGCGLDDAGGGAEAAGNALEMHAGRRRAARAQAVESDGKRAALIDRDGAPESLDAGRVDIERTHRSIAVGNRSGAVGSAVEG